VSTSLKKPGWLKVRIPSGTAYKKMRSIVRGRQLHTVCEEALCPNLGTCWEHGRATIMILGEACTRNCSFCNVGQSRSGEVDTGEPGRVAEAVKAMDLKDVVVTSVTRDDLEDGGAGIWAETVLAIRAAVPGILVEVLVPDFGGSEQALDTVIATRPDVFGHNLETVRSLYGRVRPEADYERSLGVLRKGSARGLIVKTGMMVGLGETADEMFEAMADARATGCSILYIGQYLQPTKAHLPVSRYVEPAEFETYEKKGLEVGFDVVVSGPLVRSSYHSDDQEMYVRGERTL